MQFRLICSFGYYILKMNLMKTLQKELNDPLRVYHHNFWVYILTGFWPYDFPVRWKFILFKFYQFVVGVAYFGTLTCFFIDAYLVRHDMEKLSFNLTSSVLVVVTMLKISMLRTQRHSLESLLDQVENNFYVSTVCESEEGKKIFKRTSEAFRMITRSFYILLLVIYPLRLIAGKALDPRSYIIPMPFREQLDPYYDIVYSQQVIISFHFLITVSAHDVFVYGIVIRLLAHYEILQTNILKVKYILPRRDFERYVPGYFESEAEKRVVNDVVIGKENSKEKVQDLLNTYGFDKTNDINWEENKEMREETAMKILKQCIVHHQKLLWEIKRFGNIYSKPLLVQAFSAVILSGVVVLHLIFITSQVTLLLAQQVLYVLTTLMNILYLCTFGSEMTSKSVATGNTLYDTPWYEMSIKNRMIIQFMLKRFKEPPFLKGGGMVDINRVSYLKFLQTSYNMVAVFKNA